MGGVLEEVRLDEEFLEADAEAREDVLEIHRDTEHPGAREEGGTMGAYNC